MGVCPIPVAISSGTILFLRGYYKQNIFGVFKLMNIKQNYLFGISFLILFSCAQTKENNTDAKQEEDIVISSEEDHISESEKDILTETGEDSADNLSAINKMIPVRGITFSAGNNNLTKGLEINSNYVQIFVSPQVLETGEVIECYDYIGDQTIDEIKKKSKDTETIIVERIKEAQKLGFKIYLILYPNKLGDHEAYGRGLKDPERFLDEMEKLALKWAQIAEQNNVEIFSPANEIFLFVGTKRANQWHDEILPELRQLYKGELCPRGLQFYRYDPLSKEPVEMENIQFDFSGWDYVTSDFYYDGIQDEKEAAIERLNEGVIATLAKSIELKNKYDTKGIFYGEMSHPGGSTPEIFDLFFKENYGKAEGWFFWEENSNFADEIFQVVKDYFTEVKEISDTPVKIPAVHNSQEIAKKIPEMSDVVFEDNFNGGVFESKQGKFYELKNPGDNNYTVSAKLKIIQGAVQILFERDEGGENPYSYAVSIMPASVIELYKKPPDGELLNIVKVFLKIEYNHSCIVKISRNDNHFAVYFDDDLVYAFTDPEPLTGRFSLGHYDPLGISIVIYEEIKVLK
jgi:hypothetical protein